MAVGERVAAAVFEAIEAGEPAWRRLSVQVAPGALAGSGGGGGADANSKRNAAGAATNAAVGTP